MNSIETHAVPARWRGNPDKEDRHMRASGGTWRRRLAGGLLLGLAGTMAQAAPYLQIGEGHLAYVYRWLLPDGTVLKQGMTDKRGRASLVARPGVTDYVLETMWGIYRVKVPEQCWKAKADQFAACIQVSEREDSEEQKRQAAASARAAEAQRELRQARAEWVEKEISPAQQEQVLQEALREQYSWVNTPAARFPEADFVCHSLDLPPPSAEAAEWFDLALGKPRGQGQEMAYVEAATRGHWRAAARLASSALDDEDWEAAQPVIAWLLKHQIPSGYAKLAELLAATSAYDGAPVAESTQSMVTSLRWRAAQLGDPVALAAMSRHFARQGRTQLADELLACAQRQNPDIR
ncbi:hypothetical protein [Azovibrio restrictus]|uniref:hypothetical protein n=1 Tax=Azovibrio restrictus TaxID=146938 RepID=UPI0012EC5028|nr:hypothetical protein [Azovibrio restrictus]